MYVKLFTSLYQGTLRGRTNEILVFTNLLAHADQHGIVDMHWQAIADETGLSREAVEQAILSLESPDLESRSPECNGCRIVRVDDHKAWGWQVVNYVKYRAIRNEDDRREQNRLAQQRYRDNKQNKPRSAEVRRGKPKQKQKQKQKEDQKTAPSASELFPGVDPQVVSDFRRLRDKLRAPITATAAKGLIREAGKAGISVQAALEMACERSWRGFKAEWIDKPHAKNIGANHGPSRPSLAQRALDGAIAGERAAQRNGTQRHGHADAVAADERVLPAQVVERTG